MGESLSWFSWYCKLWTIFVQLFVLHCMVQSAYLEMESSFNQQSANIKQHKNISTISSRDFTKAQGWQLRSWGHTKSAAAVAGRARRRRRFPPKETETEMAFCFRAQRYVFSSRRMLLPSVCVLAFYFLFGFLYQLSPTLGLNSRVPSQLQARPPRDSRPPASAPDDYIPLDIEPLVDNSPARNPVQDLQDAVPNLPSRYWLKKDKGMGMNKTCAKYPSLYQIRFNNGRWQTFDTSNGTFYLFNAYYDNRTLAERPAVRVLGMLNRVDPQLNTSCQLWFNGTSKPVFAKVSEYKYIWIKAFGNYKNGVLQPYLLSCQVPSDYAHQVPESVSLVERPCDTSTTNLRVLNNRPPEGKTKDFAVCVKGLDIHHADKSILLVEWLETLYLLGADKVFLYDLHVHPNTAKVLTYYQKTGFVDLTKLTLPGDQPNIPGLTHKYLKEKGGYKRLNELVPYNDCLYRNIYSYKYVVLLDIDEIIIPKNTSSWRTLMKVLVKNAFKANKKPRTSFAARNVYFLDSMQEKHGFYKDIPQYMHMLQHVHRARNYTKPGAYAKCFHDTQSVFTLHNHFPFSCLGKGCHAYYIPTEDAHLQHYRQECVGELRKVCESEFKAHTVKDTAIWRYKKSLIIRTSKALRQLGFFRQKSHIS